VPGEKRGCVNDDLGALRGTHDTQHLPCLLVPAAPIYPALDTRHRDAKHVPWPRAFTPDGTPARSDTQAPLAHVGPS